MLPTEAVSEEVRERFEALLIQLDARCQCPATAECGACRPPHRPQDPGVGRKASTPAHVPPAARTRTACCYYAMACDKRVFFLFTILSKQGHKKTRGAGLPNSYGAARARRGFCSTAGQSSPFIITRAYFPRPAVIRPSFFQSGGYCSVAIQNITHSKALPALLRFWRRRRHVAALLVDDGSAHAFHCRRAFSLTAAVGFSVEY